MRALVIAALVASGTAFAWEAMKDSATFPVSDERSLTPQERLTLRDLCLKAKKDLGIDVALVITEDVGLEGLSGSAENTRKAWKLDPHHSVIVMVALDAVENGKRTGLNAGVFATPEVTALTPEWNERVVAIHAPRGSHQSSARTMSKELLYTVLTQLRTKQPPAALPPLPVAKPMGAVHPPPPPYTTKPRFGPAFIGLIALISLWAGALQVASARAKKGVLLMPRSMLSIFTLGGGVVVLALGGLAFFLKGLDVGSLGGLASGIAMGVFYNGKWQVAMCPKCHKPRNYSDSTVGRGIGRVVTRVWLCPACGDRDVQVTKYVRR